MTAIDHRPVYRSARARRPLTVDTEALRAWIAARLGLPEVFPGDWFL